MRCFYHLDQYAVASCHVCNRFICRHCSENGYNGICWYCYQSKEEELRQKYRMLGKRSIPEMKREAIQTSIAYLLGFGILGFFVSVSYLFTVEERNYLLAIVGFLISPYLGFSLYWALKAFYDSTQLQKEKEAWLNQKPYNVTVINFWGNNDGLALYYILKIFGMLFIYGIVIGFSPIMGPFAFWSYYNYNPQPRTLKSNSKLNWKIRKFIKNISGIEAFIFILLIVLLLTLLSYF